MDSHDETTDMLLVLDNIYYGLMEPMYYAVIVGGFVEPTFDLYRGGLDKFVSRLFDISLQGGKIQSFGMSRNGGRNTFWVDTRRQKPGTTNITPEVMDSIYRILTLGREKEVGA